MSVDQAKDYRVKVTVRNNRILSLIERTHTSVAAFARDTHLPYQFLSNLICMREPARTERGEWTNRVLDLASALRVEPDEMFTERQLIGLPTASVIRHVNEEDIVSLSEQEAARLLTTDNLDRQIYGKQIADLVNLLPPRYRFVAERRFGLNGQDVMDGEDLGALMNISPARVYQMESRCITLLRNKIANLEATDRLAQLNVENLMPRTRQS
jgi:hypothetical protein